MCSKGFLSKVNAYQNTKEFVSIMNLRQLVRLYVSLLTSLAVIWTAARTLWSQAPKWSIRSVALTVRAGGARARSTCACCRGARFHWPNRWMRPLTGPSPGHSGPLIPTNHSIPVSILHNLTLSVDTQTYSHVHLHNVSIFLILKTFFF